MIKEVSSNQLKKQFDLKKLNIKSTKDVSKLKGIVGQERAVKALQFGLQMEGCGYNIYVAGSPGTGKMTSVKSFLEEIASKKKSPSDWCYVNNFSDPYQPKAIKLPAGKGTEFSQDMNHLIEHIQNEIPKAFESDEYTNQREKLLSDLNEEREKLSQDISKKASEKGFNLQATAMGIVFVPLKDDKPMTNEQLQSINNEEREELEKKRESLQAEVKATMKNIRKLQREMQEKIKDLDKKIAYQIVHGLIEDIKEKFENYEKIEEHLDDVEDDILENVDAFKVDQQQEAQNPQLEMQNEKYREMVIKKYAVNVLIDNSKQKGAPVIVEYNPTYSNIVGRIEKEMRMGALSTDFSMIKAGSLARANGGFLVISSEDLLQNVYSYDGLKRALKSSELQIEELTEKLGFVTTKTLRPQPINLDIKVVLVGSPLIYYLLYQYDTDFSELFKVKADYDTQMGISSDNISNFLSFVSTYCENENLKHFDKKAVIKLLEHASRMAEDQEKLSTEFGHIADLVREANFYAKDGLVTEENVKKALDERIYRSSLIQNKIEEMIKRGTILIDTKGEVVGQVNGLSVIMLGDYMFGRPSRITATVGPGREGIIDIEREVKLGGPIHSKGILIISGYLSKKYGLGKPLTLAARIVFEQSYQGIEGDSASAAETFSIISAISEIPLSQNIAVTGSVNQNGDIQAIGGVNHKIEGFYDLCKLSGLSGNQGVIIPKSNLQNVNLRDDVVEAVKKKKFHVWAIKTIDEGLEILMNGKSGNLLKDNTFTKNSINEEVRLKLNKYQQSIKEINADNKK